MEEELSRVKQNEKLYIIENYDHKFRILIYYFLLPILLMLSLFMFPLKAKALTTIDVTSGIYTTSDCTTTSTAIQHKYCVADDSVYNDLWSKVGISEYASNNVRAISFQVRTAYPSNSNFTLQIKGMRFNNVSYSCTSSIFACSVSYVSTSQLNVNFTSGQVSQGDISVTFHINAPGFQTFNGVNLFKIDQFVLLANPVSSSGSGSGGSFDDTNIIINQNQNTNEIINSQNQNAQSIINNQSQNSIDEQMSANNDAREQMANSCKNAYHINIGKGKRLDGSGQLVDDPNGYYMTDYVAIDSIGAIGSNPNRIYLINPASSSSGYYFMFYDTNKNIITYSNTATRSLTIPSGAVWFRFAAKIPTTIVYRGSNVCLTASDETNDLIKDDSIDQNHANSFFNDFEDTDNGGISAIVTKPLVIINNLLSNNSSCSNLQLPSFLGVENAYLPSGCILWNNAPTNVVNLWNIFVVGIGSYFILKSLFKDIQKLKNPENDSVEVMDL